MLKKNLFHKKFTKILLSITKRIESFFNIFRDRLFVKKFYFWSNKKTIDKKFFIALATIFITIIVYFLLPSFYNKNEVRAQLEDQIFQKYNFKVKLNKNLYYGLFPSPHFLSEDAIIEHDSKNIAISKKTKFFISSKNLFIFDKIKIKNLVFVETDFKISFSNFKYFLNLSNNLISDQNIKFLKSKFFYLDQRDDVIFYTEINKLSYLFKEENLNKINSKLEIFNLPISLDAIHDVSNKDILIKVDFRPLNLKIENNSNYNDDKINGQLSFYLISKDKLVNYTLNNNVLSFNSKNQKLNGEINIKPFFLSSNLDLNEIGISKFFKNNSILVNLLKSEILNNKNLNGKISISTKNLKDLKHINKIKFDIKFEEGIVLITNLEFIFKNSVIFNINDVNLIVDNNKLKFIGDFNMKFIDINNFYSHFQIKRNYRKNIKRISSNFIFNLDDGFIEFTELKINNNNNQASRQYLRKFNSEKKDILNKIIFRNTVKEFFKKISLD